MSNWLPDDPRAGLTPEARTRVANVRRRARRGAWAGGTCFAVALVLAEVLTFTTDLSRGTIFVLAMLPCCVLAAAFLIAPLLGPLRDAARPARDARCREQQRRGRR